MCFSTEASFTAAAVLGTMGIAAFKNTSSRSQFFLAAIPILFAFQQFSEGLVWLHLSQHIGSQTLFINAQRTFLIFAFLIWPIWFPLALVAVEQVPWRRLLLYLNLACGIALSVFNLSYALQQEPSVHIVHHSLQYFGEFPKQTFIYPLIVVLPCFLSSLRNVWLFGMLGVISYVVAAHFYTVTFISVWCFFAAIISLFVYKLIKDGQFESEKRPL